MKRMQWPLLGADNHRLIGPCEVTTADGEQTSKSAPAGASTQEAAEVQAGAVASQASSRGALAGSKRKAVDRDEKAGKAAKAHGDGKARVGHLKAAHGILLLCSGECRQPLRWASFTSHGRTHLAPLAMSKHLLGKGCDDVDVSVAELLFYFRL